MTKQKQIIYEIIQASQEHLTAEEIFLRAKEESPSLAIATVYRNLGLMVRDGEIRRITGSGPDRYDRSVSEHDHFVCVKCGRLCDAAVEGLKAKLEQLTGRPIISYQLRMYVICPECAGRADQGPDKG